MSSDLVPSEIRLHAERSSLCLVYANDGEYTLSSEYLRVHSPSADVAGHSPASATLQLAKWDVRITAIEAVGNYAVRLVFDDGHATGIYTWKYLHELARDRDANWQAYLQKLAAGGHEHPQLED